ncbi:hypothetical protein GA0070617_5424 [Micromonospora yangpuensis]|uniref:Uncharacterized protein n=1 Tax=Micromonospora yangpuensis TaxID=683228 RepID=A0A1C6VDL8_9ACTN|nr:hypothetical protein GA0070617_5424 [Micromonospora yangpuensis]
MPPCRGRRGRSRPSRRTVRFRGLRWIRLRSGRARTPPRPTPTRVRRAGPARVWMRRDRPVRTLAGWIDPVPGRTVPSRARRGRVSPARVRRPGLERARRASRRRQRRARPGQGRQARVRPGRGLVGRASSVRGRWRTDRRGRGSPVRSRPYRAPRPTWSRRPGATHPVRRPVPVPPPANHRTGATRQHTPASRIPGSNTPASRTRVSPTPGSPTPGSPTPGRRTRGTLTRVSRIPGTLTRVSRIPGSPIRVSRTRVSPTPGRPMPGPGSPVGGTRGICLSTRPARAWVAGSPGASARYAGAGRCCCP